MWCVYTIQWSINGILFKQVNSKDGDSTAQAIKKYYNAQNTFGDIALHLLHLACKNGYFEVVQVLVDDLDLSLTNNEERRH